MQLVWGGEKYVGLCVKKQASKFPWLVAPGIFWKVTCGDSDNFASTPFSPE